MNESWWLRPDFPIKSSSGGGGYKLAEGDDVNIDCYFAVCKTNKTRLGELRAASF